MNSSLGLFQPSGKRDLYHLSPLKEVLKDLANAEGVGEHICHLILGLKQPQAGICERLRRFGMATPLDLSIRHNAIKKGFVNYFDSD